MITREEVLEKAKRIIADNVPDMFGSEIDEDTVLNVAGNVDSMGFILVLTKLEGEVGARIPNSEWDSLRTLGEYSFYDCSDAYSVVIPEGVTEIPAYCFAGCRHLCSVTLPESLVTIGERAFNKAYYAGATVADIREIYIPKGVQHIDDYALGFRGNDQIEIGCQLQKLLRGMLGDLHITEEDKSSDVQVVTDRKQFKITLHSSDVNRIKHKSVLSAGGRSQKLVRPDRKS